MQCPKHLVWGLFSVSILFLIWYVPLSYKAKIENLLQHKLQVQSLTQTRLGSAAMEREKPLHERTSHTSDTSGRIITLFTTLRDVKARKRLHNQTLGNWASLAPAVLPVLYLMPSDSKYWTCRATELGWKLEKVPRTRGGVPTVKDMFNVTSQKYPSPFIGFANADNMFGNSLVETLVDLTQNNKGLLHDRMSLIVGRRRGIKDIKINDTSGDYVDAIAPRLKLYPSYAQDYFLFGSGGKFYWDRVPDFVVGRIGYDNWLVVMAQRWNISLIDGTQTLHNLHQEGTDGRESGRLQNEGKNKLLNYEVAGNFKYRGALTTCAFWRSVNCSRPIRNGGTISSVCLDRVKDRKRCRNPDREKVRERD